MVRVAPQSAAVEFDIADGAGGVELIDLPRCVTRRSHQTNDSASRSRSTEPA